MGTNYGTYTSIIKDGDTVMIVTKNTGFTDINDIVR